MKTSYFVLFFFLSMLNSCQDKDTKTIKSMYGKEIVFDGLTQYKKDSVGQYDSLMAKKLKIVIFYDNQGCSNCRLREISSWNKLVAQARQYNEHLGFVFIFQPKKMKAFDGYIALYKFNQPIYIDRDATFASGNKLPDDNRFHTFLLDENNKIILVGSPIENEAMWELYLKMISDKI